MPTFLDALPIAVSVSPTDVLLIDQGGTVGVPGSATSRQVPVSLFPGATSSTSLVTATNSTTPRTLANRFADVANVLDYGADPAGVADSTAAINAAASTTVNGLYRDVWLPSGNYVVTNELAIGNGQTLFGDGRGLTNLMVTTTLSSSARGIVVMSGREGLAPVIRDLSITFAQPPDTVTTTTAPTTAGNNTITVASVLNILIGGSVHDATAAAAIPNFTTVVSVVGNVVTLSANIAAPGVGSGDSIHFNTSRALFQTLAGGATVGAGGTGCKYPPAIYSDTANRFKIYDVRIQGAWDGINAGSASQIGGFFIENIECGAINSSLFLDQSFDFGHIAHFHSWPFGMGGNINSQVYSDGQTKSADLGAVEGLAIDDFVTFLGYFNLNAAASGGWFHIGNLQLNQTQLDVDGAFWCLIDNLECLRGTPATAVQNGINVSGGNVQIDNIYATTNVPFPLADVSGGRLAIYGGTVGNQFESPHSLTVSGGILELHNLQLGADLGSVPLIHQVGASGTLIVHNCQFPTNVSGVGVLIDTDSAAHSIQGNNFNGWSFTPPGSLGSYANIISDGAAHTALQSTGLSAICLPGDANGAILSLHGNGTTTPNKYIRSFNGSLQVLNSNFASSILTLSDAGNLFVVGFLNVEGALVLQDSLVMGSSAIQWGILQNAGTLAPTTGGTGYVVGDVITLTGGATVAVITVTAGAVTEFQVQQVGSYTTVPTAPLAQTATSGVGTGFTVAATFGPIAATVASMPLSSKSALQGNFVLGYNAGFSVTTGAENVFIGPYAGLTLTTGNFNTSLGHRAMGLETTGGANTAIGNDNQRNTRGISFATSLGTSAHRNWNGNQCVAIGAFALEGNEDGSTTGDFNVAIGTNALQAQTATHAFENIAIGVGALSNITAGHDNVVIGFSAAQSLTTGTFNLILGTGVGGMTTGSGNIVLGTSSFVSVAAAQSNTLTIQGNGTTPTITATGINTATPAVSVPGTFATPTLIMGLSQISWGILPVAGNSPPATGGTGYVVGDVITLTGGATVSVITVTVGAVTEFQVQQCGSYTTVPTVPLAQTATSGVGTGFTVAPAFGPIAANIGGMPLSAGGLQGNFVLGYNAGFSVTTGAEETFIGAYAGLNVTTGNNNTAFGHRALGAETNGGGNVAIGGDSQRNTSGISGATSVGSNALRSWNSTNSVAVGTLAMQGNDDGSSVGATNTAVGAGALKGLLATTASNNTAVGFGSLNNITTGHDNAAFGLSAGGSVTTGTFNTLLGVGVGGSLATGSGNIVIGTSSFASIAAAASDTLTIQGNSATIAIKGTALNGTPIIYLPGAKLTVGDTGLPTITSGAGAPAATEPNGSLYLRTDGGASTRLYVSEGGGTWAPITSA